MERVKRERAHVLEADGNETTSADSLSLTRERVNSEAISERAVQLAAARTHVSILNSCFLVHCFHLAAAGLHGSTSLSPLDWESRGKRKVNDALLG